VQLQKDIKMDEDTPKEKKEETQKKERKVRTDYI
jgi:hypothetical protein